MLYYSFIIIKR